MKTYVAAIKNAEEKWPKKSVHCAPQEGKVVIRIPHLFGMVIHKSEFIWYDGEPTKVRPRFFQYPMQTMFSTPIQFNIPFSAMANWMFLRYQGTIQ